MKATRIIQFVASAVLVSIGCGVLLYGAPIGLAAICFCLPSIMLLRRSEMSRLVPARELWMTVGGLATAAAFMVLANHFLPRSSSEYWIRQPLVVGAFWMVALVALFWRWKRERWTDA